MPNILELVDKLRKEGYSEENAQAKLSQDIDIDFIRYSLRDEAIEMFIRKLNCLPGIYIEVVGDIEDLKQQDYQGKRIYLQISDENGAIINSKLDLGVHKNLQLEQQEYCFDICMEDDKVSH